MSYQIKYFKYKQKYLELKKSLKNLDLTGGKVTNNANLLELNKLPDTPTDMEIYGYNLKNQVAGNPDPDSDSSVEFSDESVGGAVADVSPVAAEPTVVESKEESESESESKSESKLDSEGDNQNAALEAIGGGIKKDFIELSELSSISDSEMN